MTERAARKPKKKGSGLTRAQRHALKRIRKDGFVIHTHESAGEERYETSGGHRLNARTVRILIKRGALISRSDGLFEDDAQAYVAADVPAEV